MDTKNNIATILAGLIIGGLAHWFQPYGQMTILEIHIWWILSIGSFIVSILLKLYLQEKPLKIALMVSLGVVLALLARIIYDVTFWDSTSHNLAPFEFILSGIVAVPSALAGVYIGVLFKKKLPKN